MSTVTNSIRHTITSLKAMESYEKQNCHLILYVEPHTLSIRFPKVDIGEFNQPYGSYFIIHLHTGFE